MNPWNTTKSLALLMFLVAGGITVHRYQSSLRVAQGAEPSPAPPLRIPSLPILGRVPDSSLGTVRAGRLEPSQLQGKVWLAGLLSRECGEHCARTLAALRIVKDRLSAHPSSSELAVVLFSSEPELTPDPSPIWLHASGTQQELAALAATFHPVQPDDLAHSDQLALIDGMGQIRGRFDADDSEALERALVGVDRLLLETEGHVCFPPEARAPDWLASRAADQAAAWEERSVFHDFRFRDQLPDSGITFRHRCNDNCGRLFQPVHYDHGNGILAADVDGDGLHDLLFLNQVGSNQLWKNLGNARFRDVTEDANVGISEKTCVSGAFADFDNDGDQDLYVTTVRDGNVLLVNDGTGLFSDLSELYGVDHRGHSSGCIWFDYDSDGWLDLFVSNIGQYTSEERLTVANDATTRPFEAGEFHAHEGLVDAFAGHLSPERTETSILFRNLGGAGFEDVTRQVGLSDSSWSGDAIAILGNSDRWPDLYLLNMQGKDQYFENQAGRCFLNKTEERFPSTPWGSMGVAVLDFDRDERLDLYVTDMHSDMSAEVGPEEENRKSTITWPDEYLDSPGPNVFGNAFFRNTEQGYREVSDPLGVENYWPWGPTAADFNADGFTDLFVASSMNFNFRYGVNSLFLNDQGRSFLAAEFVLGIEPRRGGRTVTPWFTFDTARDTESDHHPHFQERRGKFTVWGAVGSRAGVAFDLDGDGDLDLVTTEFNSEPQFLVSNLSEQTQVSYLEIVLVGDRSNRDGIGSIVKVRTASGVQTQWNSGKSGYLSQSQLPLYFGLGRDLSIESVEVHWPSGVVQTRTQGLVLNSTLVIEEASSR